MNGRFVFADADAASRRTRERRRQKDIAFLERMRSADLEELETLRDHHRHKTAPKWKQVAIERAIERLHRGAYPPSD